MDDARTVKEILGGEEALGVHAMPAATISDLEHDGVPLAAAYALAERFQLGLSEILGIVGGLTSHPSTVLKEYWERQRRPGLAQKLGAVQSPNLVAGALTLAHAEQVFGSDREIAAWLRAPQPVLQGRRPVDLLGDADGRRTVDDVLTRIEHGVFA